MVFKITKIMETAEKNDSYFEILTFSKALILQI